MNIEQEIKNWDGKSSSDIADIYDRYGNNDGFVEKIIHCSGVTTLQNGATWLLKCHCEVGQNGQKIQKCQASKIVDLLPSLEHWESKLHILQCIPHMEITSTKKKEVELFLRKCLTDKNKFVRAWTYNGFYELSLQHPEYVTEAKQFLEMAMRDESPSVKARIRNILKKASNKSSKRDA